MSGGSRHAALLRGINVGGHSLLKMADLRALAEDLGLDDVATHLQSGNLLLGAADPAGAAAALERAVSARVGRPVAVLLRGHAELAALAAANPFPEALSEPSRLHVVFLDREPDDPGVLDPHGWTPDRLAVAGRHVFVHYPEGAGRSKLTLDRIERALGVSGTARNWNTVTALIGMTAAS